jgi:glycosyltransferase involved in cell wall biosynthesis
MRLLFFGFPINVPGGLRWGASILFSELSKNPKVETIDYIDYMLPVAKFLHIPIKEPEIGRAKRIKSIKGVFVSFFYYFILLVVKTRSSNLQLKLLKILCSKSVKDRHYDYVFLQETGAGSVEMIKAVFPNAKVIVYLNNPSKFVDDVISKKDRKRYCRNLGNADKIIVLTKSEIKGYVNKAKEYGEVINENNIEVVNNSLPEGKYEKSLLANKVIAFVSRFDPVQKGLDTMFKVAEQLPEGWRIQWAGSSKGSGNSYSEKYVRDYIRKNRLENKLELVGELSKPQLQNFLTSSSIYLSTSTFDGFPTSTLEAMAHGLPVVTTLHEGAIEVQQDNSGKDLFGLTAKINDINGIVKQLSKLTESKSLLEKYGKLSLERVKKYSKENYMKRIYEIVGLN